MRNTNRPMGLLRRTMTTLAAQRTSMSQRCAPSHACLETRITMKRTAYERTATRWTMNMSFRYAWLTPSSVVVLTQARQMTFRKFMSLTAMAFLWTGSQIPLYLFGSSWSALFISQSTILTRRRRWHSALHLRRHWRTRSMGMVCSGKPACASSRLSLCWRPL